MMKFASTKSPRKASDLPKGWPSNVQYVPQPYAGDKVEHSLLRKQVSEIQFVDTDEAPLKAPTGPVAHVKIQTIADPRHPACNQHGLFAAKNLDPNTFILLYCGVIHGPEEASEESNYDLSLDRENSIGIDAAQYGNEARFVNDYRGVRDAGPNAEFRDVWMDLGNGMAQKGIGIFVLGPG